MPAGEKIVASESDVSARGVNDAYDIYLVKLKNGQYKLIVFMKLQFFFADGDGGKWNAADKRLFVNRWQQVVKSRWSNRVLKNLSGGKRVTFELRFKTQIGGFMFDHWEITVEKVKKFTTSSVNPVFGNVSLDSLDFSLTPKKGGQRQRGAVHEFGHMLGLEDEYTKGHKHKKNYKSVMNAGETVLTRHDATHMKWLNNQLKQHGIK
jgi:hypothetical protein